MSVSFKALPISSLYKSVSPACSTFALFAQWVGSDQRARMANSAAPFAAASMGSDRRNSGCSSYIAEMDEFTTSKNLGFKCALAGHENLGDGYASYRPASHRPAACKDGYFTECVS
jgi:hypothetical protein